MKGSVIYRQLAESNQEKKGREVKADAFLLKTCHISGGESRRGGRGRRGKCSSHNGQTISNNSWLLLRHFSSGSGSERAGRWCGQPFSNVDPEERAQAAYYINSFCPCLEMDQMPVITCQLSLHRDLKYQHPMPQNNKI